MKRILVTGGNKGIGLAIVSALLREHPDTFVFMGSRSLARGEAAKRALLVEHPEWGERLDVVELDVSSEDSVGRLASELSRRCSGEGMPLYGLVNNAGVRQGTLEAVLAVNTLGPYRVSRACLPLLAPGRGRIVNLTSASGPNFVATCSEEWRRFFTNPDVQEAELFGLLEQCRAIAGNASEFARRGLGDGNPYGLSKACANSFTLLLARENPELYINACTPGFIETDLTRGYAIAQGKTPAELGMRPPEEGTRAPLHLLFGALEGNGRYYGSDAKRSPLDRYRAPGTEPCRGD